MIDAICAIWDISKNLFNIEFVNYHRTTKLDIRNILSFKKFLFRRFWLHFFYLHVNDREQLKKEKNENFSFLYSNDTQYVIFTVVSLNIWT